MLLLLLIRRPPVRGVQYRGRGGIRERPPGWNDERRWIEMERDLRRGPILDHMPPLRRNDPHRRAFSPPRRGRRMDGLDREW